MKKHEFTMEDVLKVKGDNLYKLARHFPILTVALKNSPQDVLRAFGDRKALGVELKLREVFEAGAEDDEGAAPTKKARDEEPEEKPKKKAYVEEEEDPDDEKPKKKPRDEEDPDDPPKKKSRDEEPPKKKGKSADDDLDELLRELDG